MMKVFAYRKCSTCMKALKWLEIHNVEFEERAIKEENPTYEELKEWYLSLIHIFMVVETDQVIPQSAIDELESKPGIIRVKFLDPNGSV